MNIVNRVLQGERRAASRLMRLVDDRDPVAKTAMEVLYESRSGSQFIGVTGSPGAGKSTLINQLIIRYRKAGNTIGVIAVDPTSPFSGGAILGDRVRMGEHANDDGVFIRSLATRGNLGGISRSTPSLMVIMDAMKFDIVIVETVGVGQSEVDIAAFCDVNLVLAVPGMGDDIQADKAGLFEVADIFVINKADRDGADRLQRELKQMTTMGPNPQDILRTIAYSGEGVDALIEKISTFQPEKKDYERRQKRKNVAMVRMLASTEFDLALRTFLEPLADLSNPYQIVEDFFKRIS